MSNVRAISRRTQHRACKRFSGGECRYFTYNDVNLVETIQYPGGVANYFWYDAMMRRYAMQDSAGLRYFTWDQNGMNLLCERDSAGAVTTYYTHGFADVDGIGSPVAVKQNRFGAAYFQYPGYDHKGNLTVVTDENGNEVARYNYTANGVALTSEVTGGISETRLGYQTNWIKLQDAPFDMYLSPTRVEVPVYGMFLGRDPRDGLVGGYGYALANPVVLADPDGAAETPPATTEPKPKKPKPKPKVKPLLPKPDRLPADFDSLIDPLTLGLPPGVKARSTITRIREEMKQVAGSGPKKVAHRWPVQYDVKVAHAPTCTVSVVMKLQLTKKVKSVAKTGWKDAILSKWSNRFRLCCPKTYPQCSALPIVIELSYVAAGGHVKIHPVFNIDNVPIKARQRARHWGGTYDATHWGVKDTIAVVHEFGHLLGNKDRYGVIDGIDHGKADPKKGVMSHPKGDVAKADFKRVADAVGKDCKITPVQPSRKTAKPKK